MIHITPRSWPEILKVGLGFVIAALVATHVGAGTLEEDFREEFQRRKGYDLLPWLVTMGATVHNGGKDAALRTVGSAEQTARFEWDYRDVIATLFYEHGWQPAVEMIHAAGAKVRWNSISTLATCATL